MKKIINFICVGLAFVFLALGGVGIILPILPATPFLLLATALFAKGSERFHMWFTSTRLYRNYIEDTIKKKKMTARAKGSVLAVITCLFTIGFILSPVWYARVIILLVVVFHYYYFLFRIKTVKVREG